MADEKLGTSKFDIQELYGRAHGGVKTTDVTVSGASPTKLPPVMIDDRKDLRISNASGVTIYIGGEGVTKFNGFPLAAGGTFSALLGRAELYAVTDSTTVSGVRVMEIV